MKVLVAQSGPTLCDPVDCSPSVSSVHGILQARISEPFPIYLDFPASSASKESSCNSVLIPGLERSLEKGWATHSSILGLPGGSDGKESTCNAGDLGLIPGLGRSPGGEHGNPFQYSCLENPMHRGAWWATVHGFRKNWT